MYVSAKSVDQNVIFFALDTIMMLKILLWFRIAGGYFSLRILRA
jgi:aryl carrier-like protein